MTPDRSSVVAGRKIEEFYWAGEYVVYVDHRASKLCYEDAVRAASVDRSGAAGETPKSGSTEGESAVPSEETGDAPPPSPSQPSTGAGTMMNADARSSVMRRAGREWGDWAKWPGGERPVSGRTLTQVRLRSGVMSPPVWAAEIIWKHGMLGVTADDVVAYRTAQED